MARPQRNNVDYFPFICEDGNKMFYIEETYGNDGFATFVKILRELAKTNFHYIDLSKKSTMMYLSAKCKIPVNLLELIISDCVEIGKFDKQLWDENKVVWCQDLVDSIQDAYIKRKSNCITKQGLFLLLEGLGIRKQSKRKLKGVINPQSIEEDSIEDNNNDVLPVIETTELEKTLDEFYAMRKRMKKEATDHAKDLIVKELTKLAGTDEAKKVAIVNQSIVNGYLDVYPLKAKTVLPTFGQPEPIRKQSTFEELKAKYS